MIDHQKSVLKISVLYKTINSKVIGKHYPLALAVLKMILIQSKSQMGFLHSVIQKSPQ